MFDHELKKKNQLHLQMLFKPRVQHYHTLSYAYLDFLMYTEEGWDTSTLGI